MQDLKKKWLKLSKMTWAIWQVFTRVSLEIGTLMGSKAENVWAQQLQGSFLSWQWRMIPNLQRNWLVSSKLTWGIWQILTRALENLKNLHFNWLLLTKVFNVWAKKGLENFCLMALKIDAKFEGKLSCAFQNFRIQSEK